MSGPSGHYPESSLSSINEDVVELLSKLPTRTPQEDEILRTYYARKRAAVGRGAGNEHQTATMQRSININVNNDDDNGSPHRRRGPPAGSAASLRLASAGGFTNLPSDTRMSAVSPEMRQRIEHRMRQTEAEWRVTREPQQQQQRAMANQEEADDMARQPTGNNNNNNNDNMERVVEAMTASLAPAQQQRVHWLLDEQRRHLLAAAEMDYELRQIWWESSGRKA
ncbi:hypothetical protein ColTof4_01142 [Colletotrichum tofieldiae]|nr:hypothetical protein ColTof3_08368 [Colletotrichum tofieldiae]GKT68719.1 hypothetical protein ColTof4_01142 [Colletotrichum tofieldiae]GKT96737.1 hypothetical protein Ct61P_14587 [Colletotrichum tofieldiae]